MTTLDIVRQSLYITFGSCCFVSNTFVIFVIARCKELHFNAHFLTAALAATDVLSGLTFAASGAYRLRLFLCNETEILITPGECIGIPSSFMFALSYHVSPMMILLISLDRLLAVTAVKFYFVLGMRYTFSLITFCISYMLAFFAYWAYDMMAVMPQVPSVTKFCWGVNTDGVHLYDYWEPLCLFTASVLIMIATLLVLRFRTRHPHVGDTSGSSQQSKSNNSSSVRAISAARNASAARLLAFISFKTFLMRVVPEIFVEIIDTYGYDTDGLFAQIAPFLWMLQPVHGVTNLALYFRKGSQIRVAYEELKKPSGWVN